MRAVKEKFRVSGKGPIPGIRDIFLKEVTLLLRPGGYVESCYEGQREEGRKAMSEAVRMF